MSSLTWLHPRLLSLGCFGRPHTRPVLYGLSYCPFRFHKMDAPARRREGISPNPPAGFAPAFIISSRLQDGAGDSVFVAHIRYVCVVGRSSPSATAPVATGQACFHASGGAAFSAFFGLVKSAYDERADSTRTRRPCRQKAFCLNNVLIEYQIVDLHQKVHYRIWFAP